MAHRLTEWGKANPEKRAASLKTWKAENKIKLKEYKLKWQKENREKYLAAKRKSSKRQYHAKPIEQRRSPAWKVKYEKRWTERIEQYGMPKECAICTDSIGRNENQYLGAQWDHSHTTGEFRGWLCRGCNLGLGHMKDDIDRLLKAVEYLKAFKQ